MEINVRKYVRIYLIKIKESIAFYPAIIATSFLLLSFLMIELDFSDYGKQVKSNSNWLTLKDATTARSIISTVAGALISLTVFSFSMVMIVLNQAASQMSNRVLSSMIENRFQQTVLGFYIGTIVYALFLLTTIRDVSSGIYVPALSIYLLIVFIVVDIFLFIYFLDYVTQSVKYETIIDRVKNQTLKTLQNQCEKESLENPVWIHLIPHQIYVQTSGYFQNFNHTKLLKIAKENDLFINFQHQPTTYLLKGLPFATIYCKIKLEAKVLEDVCVSADFFNGQPIDINADYGFRQLTEVALKALSPGINDPASAVLALHALSDLFSYKLHHKQESLHHDSNNVIRINIPAPTFDELFSSSIDPIWNYGKDDEYIQKTMTQLLNQLKIADAKQQHHLFLNRYEKKMVCYCETSSARFFN